MYARKTSDKLRIYLAGYDPLDREDVEMWEKGESTEDVNKIFKFFFHNENKSGGKRPIDNIFKMFNEKPPADEEEDEEEEEFLRESRRRKEEKKNREEHERMIREDERRKIQEEMRNRVEAEQQRKLEDERRKKEEQRRIQEEVRKQRALEEEKLRVLELQRKQEEQKKRYFDEQERRIQEEKMRLLHEKQEHEEKIRILKEQQIQQENRHKFGEQWQRARSTDGASNQRPYSFAETNQRDDGTRERMGFQSMKDDLNKQGKASTKSGKKKKKSKKDKKLKKKSKGGETVDSAGLRFTKGTDGKWYEKLSDGRWVLSLGPDSVTDETSFEETTYSSADNRETITDANGNVFVKADDGSWFMRVQPPTMTKKSDPHMGAQRPLYNQKEEPKVKIITGGVYKDKLGRIVDNDGNVYLSQTDGSLKMIGNLRGDGQNTKSSGPGMDRGEKIVTADPRKSYFRDKNGIPYYIDERGNYVRVATAAEQDQRPNRAFENQRNQFSYRDELSSGGKEKWQRQYEESQIFRTDPQGQWQSMKNTENRYQNTGGSSKMSSQGQNAAKDLREEIMRQQERIAQRLMDAQLGQTTKEKRYKALHEEL